MEIDITVLRIKMEDTPTFTTTVTPKHIIADLDIHMSFPICTEWTPAMQLSPGTRVSCIFIRRHLDWGIRDNTGQRITIHTELRTITCISQSAALCDCFGDLQEAIAKAVFR